MENQKASKSIKSLITPLKDLHKKVDGVEVSLEELESLCSGFQRRPRGCSSFASTGDSDDLLF